MKEVCDLAGQHEVIAENLQSNVIREVSVFVKDFKEERKKVCNLQVCSVCSITFCILFSQYASQRLVCDLS
jgi:hypothetical protein